MLATREWIEISEDRARRHSLFGVKGWLVFLAIGLVLLSLLRAVNAAGALSDWPLETSNALIRAAESFEIAAGAAMAAAHLGAFFLLMTRSSRFPKVVLALAVLGIVLPLGYLALIHLGATLVGDAELIAASWSHVLRSVAFNVVIGTAAVLYVLTSRRVNVTFLNRVHVSELDAVGAAPGDFQTDSHAPRGGATRIVATLRL